MITWIVLAVLNVLLAWWASRTADVPFMVLGTAMAVWAAWKAIKLSSNRRPIPRD